MGDNETASINHDCADHLPQNLILNGSASRTRIKLQERPHCGCGSVASHKRRAGCGVGSSLYTRDSGHLHKMKTTGNNTYEYDRANVYRSRESAAIKNYTRAIFILHETKQFFLFRNNNAGSARAA